MNQPTTKKFLKTVRPRETKEYRVEVRHKVRGCRTKLGVAAFMWSCFKINEEVDSLPYRFTNAELIRQFNVEYKGSPKTITTLKEKKPSINDYRHRYNRGTLCSWGDAPYLSFRWNKLNTLYLPVDLRTGTKAMSFGTLYKHWQRYHKLNGLSETFDEVLIRLVKILTNQSSTTIIVGQVIDGDTFFKIWDNFLSQEGVKTC